MRPKLVRLFAVSACLAVAVPACGGGRTAAALPKGTPFPQALQERLHAIRDKQAELRGEPINQTVSEWMLTRDQLRAWYEKENADMTADERRKLDGLNRAFRLMGMMGPDDDLLKSFTTSDTEGIVGLYEPASNALVLIGDQPTISEDDEAVLAHEYVHSFQQRAFDPAKFTKLLKDEKDESDTDYRTTLSCLKEGDATFASYLYARDVFGPDWFGRDKPPASEPDPLDAVPPAILRYQAFDYDECVAFVAALHREHDDWTAVNAAYERPPTTTEQIMHPEKYLKGEIGTGMAFVDLKDQLKGWERLTAGVFGEFDVYNYLLSEIGDEATASVAAAGWGSGWISVYESKPAEQADDAVVVHVPLEFDSRTDLVQFAQAYAVLLAKTERGGFATNDAGDRVCWHADNAYGYLTVKESPPRIDLTLATSEGARDAAADTPCAGLTPR